MVHFFQKNKKINLQYIRRIVLVPFSKKIPTASRNNLPPLPNFYTKKGSAQQPSCSGGGGGGGGGAGRGGAAASLCSARVGSGPLTRWRQPTTTIVRSPAAAPAGGGSGAGSGR